MKSTIIFYTHNFLARKIFKATLQDAIRHAKENNCFLLVISHFPVFKEYIDVKEQFGGTEHITLPPDLEKFSIRDLQFDVSKDNGINYVTGKLPYRIRSILNQLIFAIEKSPTHNVILCEHDCFYPDDYYSVVEKNLDTYDMTFCKERYGMVNKNGFYNCEPHPYLSSFSAKTSILFDVLKNKEKVYEGEEIRLLEPIVPCEWILKEIHWLKNEKKIKHLIRPKTIKDINVSIFRNSTQVAQKEIVIHNSLCLDSVLDPSHCILEFEHGLNTTASLAIMRVVYDNGDLEKEYKECMVTHPYWGNSKRFIEMLEPIEENNLSKKAHAVGIHRCEL